MPYKVLAGSSKVSLPCVWFSHRLPCVSRRWRRRHLRARRSGFHARWCWRLVPGTRPGPSGSAHRDACIPREYAGSITYVLLALPPVVSISLSLAPNQHAGHDTLRIDVARAVPTTASQSMMPAPGAPVSALPPPPPPSLPGFSDASSAPGSRIPRLRHPADARGNGEGTAAAPEALSVVSSVVAGDRAVAEQTSRVAMVVEWLATLNIALKEPWALTVGRAWCIVCEGAAW